MSRRGRRILGVVVLAALLGAGLLWRSFAAAPLPRPAPYAGELPAASPPAGMKLFRLPTGVTHRNAAVAYRGGSFGDERDFTMSALLVRHPRGDVLIDTGFGRELEAQLQAMPWWFRVLTPYERGRSAAEQLGGAEVRAVLLTHAHWDHASGAGELGAPVWVTPEERRFIDDGGWITAVARGLRGVRWEEYGFEGGEYLGFPRSRDVYGDGSIVVVPAPGHTPGSVIVFLALPDGKRYALVGDLVWQREGIALREERPWVTRVLADDDARGVRENILRMAALVERFPELVVIPAHDARAFERVPALSGGVSGGGGRGAVR
jgi:glyoxylase-like metal-dependent hydrolase (beta-lactamase superfamily II)